MSNFQEQEQQKNHKAYKEIGAWPIQNNNNEMIQNVSEEAQVLDLLDKDFKSPA